MTDQEWLSKVWQAYRVYQETFVAHERNLNHFILWLYKQYGIIPPTDKNA